MVWVVFEGGGEVGGERERERGREGESTPESGSLREKVSVVCNLLYLGLSMIVSRGETHATTGRESFL